MRKLLLILVALPGITFPQTATTENGREMVTKVVRVNQGNPEKIAALAARGTSVFADADDALGVIVVKGHPADVQRVAQTIQELDGPPKVSPISDIELIVYVIGATNNAASIQPNVPASIEPVMKQLRGIFSYSNYSLLSTTLMRSQQGKQAQSQGVINLTPFGGTGAPQRPETYSLSYRAANLLSNGSTATVHLEGFQFNTKSALYTNPLYTSSTGNTTPYATTQFNTSADIQIRSDLDIREGQKVVVGKANVGNGDSALFVVLTARSVQ